MRAEQGLTLLEILIVLGIFTVIARLALVVSMATLNQSSFQADQGSLIAALEHARAESVDGVCLGSTCTAGAAHGVSIQTDQYVIFQGPSYAARDASEDQAISASTAISHSGLTEVIFAPSSGSVGNPGDIVLSDSSGRTATTSIASEGQIIWTN